MLTPCERAGKAVTSLPSNAQSSIYRKLTTYTVGLDGTDHQGTPAMEALLSKVERPLDFGACIPVLGDSYAMSVVDTDRTFAYLVSDPLGTRPIYYTVTSNGPVWSFKLKDMLPLVEHIELDKRGLDEIIRYRWLEEGHTLVGGIKQMLPGHYVYLSLNGPPLERRYARVEFRPRSEVNFSSEDAVSVTSNALDDTLMDIRKRHSRIAILFSGGVDSSLLLAKAREYDFDKLVAVTATYPEFQNPETERAIQIASDLNVPIKLVSVEDEYVAKSLPMLSLQLERPSAYANNIVRAKLFESLASEVTLALTGEGADGMFGGSTAGSNAVSYDRQFRKIAWVPSALRVAIAPLLRNSTNPTLNSLARLLSKDTLAYVRSKGMMDPPDDASAINASDLIPSLKAYRELNDMPYYVDYEGSSASLFALCQNRGLHSQNRNQFYCYAQLAEPYDIRVEHPFVSHSVASIGLTLPDVLKADSNGTKPVLRKLLLKYLPPEVVYAEKLGFVTPFQHWLTGPLAPWISILQEERTLSRGLFNLDALQSMTVDRDQNLYWTAIGIEIFLRQFFDGDFSLHSAVNRF